MFRIALFEEIAMSVWLFYAFQELQELCFQFGLTADLGTTNEFSPNCRFYNSMTKSRAKGERKRTGTIEHYTSHHA